MPGVGSKILASDYNAIWNLVNIILGTGTGQYGYNQTLNSNQVSVKSPFKLTDWANLRLDLARIYTHQFGTSPSASLLPVPGNLNPTTVSSATVPSYSNGQYLVTFNIPIQTVAPSIGASYKIIGSANTSYNGTFVSTASSTTSVTVAYNSNPGTYDPSKPVLIASVLTYDLMQKYLTEANALYVSAYNPTMTVTASTATLTPTTVTCYTAQILMLGATITGPGIPVGTTITGVAQGQTLTISQSATSNNSNASYTITLTTGVKTVAANQQSTISLTSVSRSTSWNNNVQTIATFTFRDSNSVASADAARAFFNSGGQLEIAPVLSGSFSAGSNVKDQTWQQMFQQVGKIIFRANDTTQDNTSTGGPGYDTSSSVPSAPSSVGYYTLNTVPRLIFVKSAPTGGTYSANAMNVYANLDATGSQVLITVRFQDDAGGNVDENVDGTLTVNFTTTYASGSNVSTPIPLASATPIQ